jgi:hypothetical protein
VVFWTTWRVRVYTLFLGTLLVCDIALSIAVIARVVPDTLLGRVLIDAGLALALGTLLMRVWVGVLEATEEMD